jgi:hypothetical protein
VIFLVSISLTPALTLAVPQNEDILKNSCSTKHPLAFSKGIYTTNVIVKGEDGKPHTFKFLFDTGYSHSSLSPKACKAIGCKIVGREKLNPISNMEVNKTTPVVINLGAKEFSLARMDLDETSTLFMAGVDGVIGGDIIFKEELIVNLKSSYLCFPSTPVYQLAEQLHLQKVDAMYDAGRVWLGFYANGKKIDDYFLDTGSDTTSLLPKDIDALKLQELGEETRNASEHGFHKVKDYGPLSIKLADLTQDLKVVASASDSQMRKLGTDILSSYILGFDPETKYIFLSH